MAFSMREDELVAISATRDTWWPTALPTVERDDPHLLAESASRGLASLVERGLVRRDNEVVVWHEQLSALLVPVMQGRRLSLYEAVWGRPTAAPGQAVHLHQATPDVWIVETVADGLHEFVISNDDDVRQIVSDVVEGVHAIVDDADLTPSRRVLVITRNIRPGEEAVLVFPGGCVTGTLPPVPGPLQDVGQLTEGAVHHALRLWQSVGEVHT